MIELELTDFPRQLDCSEIAADTAVNIAAAEKSMKQQAEEYLLLDSVVASLVLPRGNLPNTWLSIDLFSSRQIPDVHSKPRLPQH